MRCYILALVLAVMALALCEGRRTNFSAAKRTDRRAEIMAQKIARRIKALNALLYIILSYLYVKIISNYHFYQRSWLH